MPLWGKMVLFCCICGRRYECSVGNTSKGYVKQACCSHPCLAEKDWRETLSTMGKDYYPDPRKETNPMTDKAQKLMIVDDLSPEDVAMLQALYSRSSESAEAHIEKVKQSGSGKFMSSFYVGYGHKSIADCGSTTMFIENVSLLAAKAIQDWPLYSGQETSTRYIDMSKQRIVDPIGTVLSKSILDDWMNFYTSNQDRVAATVKEKHPIKEGEKPETYEKAVKARAFDILRGFLPAGITTQLSWHTNLRQAGDHLTFLKKHPLPEISNIAEGLGNLAAVNYPSSGFEQSLATVSGVGQKDEEANQARAAWEQMFGELIAYPKPLVAGEQISLEMRGFENYRLYSNMLSSRPRGCVLPHFLSDIGQLTFRFLLDFGSFRDIQRHRNGVCRMPMLETFWGFEQWYLDQLDDELREEARQLIEIQAGKIRAISKDALPRQYYVALGFRVPTQVTYSLPAAVYVMELRSGKHIHPTLRKKVQDMAKLFSGHFTDIPLHVDTDEDDWTVRRGLQTITQK